MSRRYLDTWQELELAAHYMSQVTFGDRDLQLQATICDAESIGNDTVDACIRLAKKHWREEAKPFTTEWFRRVTESVEESNND